MRASGGGVGTGASRPNGIRRGRLQRRRRSPTEWAEIRSPAQSNQRAERRRSEHQRQNGHQRRTPASGYAAKFPARWGGTPARDANHKLHQTGHAINGPSCPRRRPRVSRLLSILFGRWAREFMTRPQFQEAAWRVRLYGNVLMWATGSVVIVLASLLVLWADPWIRGFGAWFRGQVQPEALAGLVFGLAAGVAFAPLLLIPLVPVLWVDRRFGLRCPGCAHSVTLRCRHGQVLQTGRCCLCQQFLFEPDDAAAPSAAADRDRS